MIYCTGKRPYYVLYLYLIACIVSWRLPSFVNEFEKSTPSKLVHFRLFGIFAQFTQSIIQSINIRKRWRLHKTFQYVIGITYYVLRTDQDCNGVIVYVHGCSVHIKVVRTPHSSFLPMFGSSWSAICTIVWD